MVKSFIDYDNMELNVGDSKIKLFGNGKNCPVCLIECNSFMKILKCKHLVCEFCLSKLYNCPCCREEVSL